MNKKLKTILFIILIIIIAVLVFVNVRGYKREVAYQGETIRIGVSIPFTHEEGPFLAESVMGGLKLAQKEINEKGGVLGKQIELIIEDDECDEEKGIKVWDKLINKDKVIAILGPICVWVTEKAFPMVEKSKVPVIMGVDSVPLLAKYGKYIFITYPSDILNGKFAADYIFTELKKTKIAVFYQKTLSEEGIVRDNPVIESIKDFFVERVNRFKDIGMEIVFNDYIVSDMDSDMIESKINQIKESGAEVIYFLLIPDSTGHEAVDIIQKSNLDLIIFGPEFVSLFPEFEGALYSIPKVNNPIEFKSKVSEIHQGGINFTTPIYYDALYILSQAIERAGKLDRELIRDEISKTSYRGIAFPIVEFDEFGGLKQAEFEVRIIKQGKSEVYQHKE